MWKWQLRPNNNTGMKPSCNIHIYIQYPFTVSGTINATFLNILYCLVLKGQIFPSRGTIQPYLAKIPWNTFCLVFSISLRRSMRSSLHPVLPVLLFTIYPLAPPDRHCAWLAEGERGCRASVEHNSPSIPPSFHPSTAPSSPSPPPTRPDSDGGVRRLWAAPRKSLERPGTEPPQEKWCWDLEANRLAMSSR